MFKLGIYPIWVVLKCQLNELEDNSSRDLYLELPHPLQKKKKGPRKENIFLFRIIDASAWSNNMYDFSHFSPPIIGLREYDDVSFIYLLISASHWVYQSDLKNIFIFSFECQQNG